MQTHTRHLVSTVAQAAHRRGRPDLMRPAATSATEPYPAVDVGELVELAAAGNERAWEALVDRYTPMLWAIARGYRLPSPDAADVIQVAWLRLVQQLPRLRQPQFVAAWLATTVRRECLSTLRRRDREQPHALDDQTVPTQEDLAGGRVDEGLLAAEQAQIVRRAVMQLAPRQQLVLRLLSADPLPSYTEISAATGIPIGSIGPTRVRALHRLRTLLEHEGLITR
jgi:RNA polymerase sigma factor (sigma-70 family)